MYLTTLPYTLYSSLTDKPHNTLVSVIVDTVLSETSFSPRQTIEVTGVEILHKGKTRYLPPTLFDYHIDAIQEFAEAALA